MKILALAASLLGLVSGAAHAADMAVKAAPPLRPVELYNWTGFYVGLNAGGSFGRDRTNDTGLYTAPVIGPAVLLYNERFSHNPVGAIAGVQAGYNWQTSN